MRFILNIYTTFNIHMKAWIIHKSNISYMNNKPFSINLLATSRYNNNKSGNAWWAMQK